MVKGFFKDRPKPSKNVFKVAGARVLKPKNKAKAVTTQLKNLSEVKLKTAEVDRQLNSLQEEVRQQGTKKTDSGEKEGTGNARLIAKDVEQFKECEKKSTETLKKLTDMSV